AVGDVRVATAGVDRRRVAWTGVVIDERIGGGGVVRAVLVDVRCVARDDRGRKNDERTLHPAAHGVLQENEYTPTLARNAWNRLRDAASVAGSDASTNA